MFVSVSQKASERNFVGGDPAASARIVHQHAFWRASQPHADANAVLASAFEANQSLGSPLDLKAVKRLAKKARPVPEVATWRDPVDVHFARKKIAAFRTHADWLATCCTGAFARNSFLALRYVLDLMDRFGTTTLALSARDLADATGTTKETASRYMRSLSGYDHRTPALLRCEKATYQQIRDGGANRYCLCPLHELPRKMRKLRKIYTRQMCCST